jgi:hypothetical protein
VPLSAHSDIIFQGFVTMFCFPLAMMCIEVNAIIHSFISQNMHFVCIHMTEFNPLNIELNSICQLLALLGAHPFLHVSRIRVNYSAVFKIG